MLRIALPKGRLGEKIYKLLDTCGYGCEGCGENSRKLVFRDEKNGVSYFWVKPADVPVYVSMGAADVGFAGKDVIDEAGEDVYELCDLKTGVCKMCVAAKKGFEDDFSRPLRVATKFPRCAERHFSQKGRQIEIIKLHGSIELAPVLGLSDVIFDIVETGTTLKENGLEVIEEAFPVSARLICNKAAYGFARGETDELKRRLEGALKI